jgi:hypothetical protein
MAGLGTLPAKFMLLPGPTFSYRPIRPAWRRGFVLVAAGGIFFQGHASSVRQADGHKGANEKIRHRCRAEVHSHCTRDASRDIKPRVLGPSPAAIEPRPSPSDPQPTGAAQGKCRAGVGESAGGCPISLADRSAESTATLG